MTPTAKHAKSASTPATGIFALLRGPLRAQGTGAPKISLPALLVTLTTVLFLACLAPTCATAAITHEYLPAPSTEISNGVPAGTKVGSQEALSGPLGELNAMTVDSGRLWIAEKVSGTQNFRVDEFDATTGAFVSQLAYSEDDAPEFLGIAVGHVSPEPEPQVYLAEVNPNAVGVYSEAGVKQSSWTGAGAPGGEWAQSGAYPTGVAVDDSGSSTDLAEGDVYVALGAQKVVDVFEANGKNEEKYLTQLTGTCTTPASCTGEEAFSNPQQVAVDALNGDVIVSDAGKLDLFEPTVLGEYTFVRTITGPSPGEPFHEIRGFAVEGSSAHIYVAEGSLVDELSSEGVLLTRITSAGTPQGARFEPRSVAVDPATEDVFVGTVSTSTEGEAGVDVFGPDLVVPDVTTGPASEETPTSATLNGTVDTDHEGEATCQFVWGTTKGFGHTTACTAPVAEGPPAVAVRAPLSGLEPDTTYFYRLQATSAKNGRTNPGEESQDLQFTTPGPGIRSESATDVAATSATLQATIDPDKASTSYRFQYGAEDCTSAVNACTETPAKAIGAGESEIEVPGQHLQGLRASAIYYYRVVVTSEFDGQPVAFAGPDQTFTTQSAGAESHFELPDDRHWEMVSPPSKHGASIEPISGEAVIQAAAGGDAITYETNGPTEAQPQGFYDLVQVLSTHGSQGWSSQDIAIPHEVHVGEGETGVGTKANGQEYPVFSEDLSLGVVQPTGKTFTPLSPEASETTPYLRRNYLDGDVEEPCSSSCFQPLVTAVPGVADVPSGTVFGEQVDEGTVRGPFEEGATPDLSHVVLESQVALTSTPDEGEPGVQGLYEWSAGKLALVSVLPKSQGGQATQGELGDREGAGAQGDKQVRGAISDDGSRVFWTQVRPGKEAARPDSLYMRDVAREETLQLDAVQGGTGAGVPHPEFQIASSNGSKVFFTDTQRLTSNAGAESGRPDLYECEIVEEASGLKCNLSDLTPLDPESKERSFVQGLVLGVSEAGSYVYFVADGVLAPGAKPGECGVANGLPPSVTCNLYVRHDGKTALVAVLSNEDSPDWANGAFSELGKLTARVSPNGRWLAFMSRRSLTGYDNRDANSGHPDQEVYLYHAPAGAGEAGTLVCASCNPTGARPVGEEYEKLEDGLVAGGNNVWEGGTWIAANIPGWTGNKRDQARYQSRYLSNSGRLFFNSDDPLVPQDINGAWDVYEYEPAGFANEEGKVECVEGSATFDERSGGCVGLISAGTSGGESAFLDASESGGDVFFLTSSELVPQDQDSALDIYDAHECTALAPCSPTPLASAPACSSADACKAAPTPQPASFGAPSSETFSGAGNILPPPEAVAKPKAKPLTRAQKLANALRSCGKRPQKKRAACERQARRAYGPARKAKKSHKGGK